MADIYPQTMESSPSHNIIQTHPVVSRLVLLRHCFVFRFELGINIRPPSTQFLGYIPNTKFWVQGFYLAAFIIAEPKKC